MLRWRPDYWVVPLVTAHTEHTAGVRAKCFALAASSDIDIPALAQNRHVRFLLTTKWCFIMRKASGRVRAAFPAAFPLHDDRAHAGLSQRPRFQTKPVAVVFLMRCQHPGMPLLLLAHPPRAL